MSIDTVDLSPIFSTGEEEWGEVAQKLAKGLHDIGAVYLLGHGIDTQLVEKTFAKTKELFSLPRETKRAYLKTDAVGDFCGFTDIGGELLGPDTPSNKGPSKQEVKEAYDMLVTRARFPAEVPEFEETMKDCLNKLENLKVKVLKLLFMALGISEEILVNFTRYLEDKSVENWTLFRVQRYPRIPDDIQIGEGSVRCAEHTDWTAITFLFQDSVGGLEIKARDGTWVQATPVPNSIVLNVGEIMEIWTRGYFPAVPHRVLLTEEDDRIRQDRYSIALFTFPDDELILEPLEKTKLMCEDYEYNRNITVRAHIDDHIEKTRGY